jgi:hypothetical protein
MELPLASALRRWAALRCTARAVALLPVLPVTLLLAIVMPAGGCAGVPPERVCLPVLAALLGTVPAAALARARWRIWATVALPLSAPEALAPEALTLADVGWERGAGSLLMG